MNLATVLVAGVVVAVFIAIVATAVRNHRLGKGGCACGGDCSQCGHCAHAGPVNSTPTLSKP